MERKKIQFIDIFTQHIMQDEKNNFTFHLKTINKKTKVKILIQ